MPMGQSYFGGIQAGLAMQQNRAINQQNQQTQDQQARQERLANLQSFEQSLLNTVTTARDRNAPVDQIMRSPGMSSVLQQYQKTLKTMEQAGDVPPGTSQLKLSNFLQNLNAPTGQEQSAAAIEQMEQVERAKARGQAAGTAAGTPAQPVKSDLRVVDNQIIDVTDPNNIQILYRGREGNQPVMQSPEGKIVSDRESLVGSFGEDSPQVAAFDELTQSSEERPSLSDEGGIRREFTNQSGSFITMRDAYKKIKSAGEDAAGDLGLIFSFMKILDPGSTVRDGEFANAQNAAGIPGRIVSAYNNALKGERLNPEQRRQFKREAEGLFRAQLESQLQLENQYKGIAERVGVNPENVIVDYAGDLRNIADAPVPPDDEKDAEFTGGFSKDGFPIFRRPDGSMFYDTPEQ